MRPRMRFTVLLLTLGGVVTSGSGQANGSPVRLEDRIETPLVYVALSAREAAAKEVPSPESEGPDLKTLLRDPDLLGQLGLSAVAGGARPGTARLLGSLLASATGEIELAMTGAEPRAGAPDQPLLAFRTHLGEAAVATLRGLFDAGERARAVRVVGSHQVYALIGSSSQVEVVLAGGDLVASNDGAVIDRVFEVGTGTHAVLARDPHYRKLRGEIESPAGSLVLYADGDRLADRLPGLIGRDHWLLGWSGLGAQRWLLGIRTAASGLVTTVLADSSGGGARDGWIALVDEARSRDLLKALPDSGIGALSVGMNPRRLLGSNLGPRMGAMMTTLTGGCQTLGIDLAGEILRPLGDSASLQAVLVGEPGRPVLAYAVRARSAAAARSLFKLCKNSIVGARAQKIDGVERLSVRGLFDMPGNEGQEIHLTVVGDSLLFAFDGEVLSQARTHALQRRDRSKLAAQLRKLGLPRRGLAGLFSFDLSALTGTAASDNPLLGAQVGYVQVEQDLIRFEALAER